MAGVVAMASVIEDFEATQPCKKMKKDDDPPPPRTITNYFMPLPKTVAKPFSPPRTNNIMDYFRKTSPVQEKNSHLQKCSDVLSTDLPSTQEVTTGLNKTQKPKRMKKIKPNKLQEQEVLTDNCDVLDSPGDSSAKKRGSFALLGSETAALLSQISSDIYLDEEPPKNKNAAKNEEEDVMQNYRRKGLAVQIEKHDHLANDIVTAGESKGKRKKAVGRKTQKAQVSQGETCNTEDEQSLHDASLEVNVDETSVLNCSTITVSYEEFLLSQNEEKAEIVADTSVAESTYDAKTCMDANVLVCEVSPRTLTVQAEVHPISPESVKGHQLRTASIFTRNKKKTEIEFKKMSSADNSQIGILSTLKRKSNVVLHEEDLELDVVESSSSPKCTKEERKQFMNAFKQPSLDGSKGKTSKVLNNNKQAKHNDPELVELEDKAEENSLELIKPEDSTEQKQAITVGKKKCKKKSGNKIQTIASEKGVTPKQEDHPTSVKVENESGCTEGKQSAKTVRRSPRVHTRRQTASVMETISSENTESVGAPRDDIVSTPVSQRQNKRVYRAEMLSPINKRGSPISRMRITRVCPTSATKAGDFETSSPLSVQLSNSLTKRKQAKKLVQKARALQQSKQSAAGTLPAVRRSARSKEHVKVNYCEDEDSVVFVDDGLCSPTPLPQGDKCQKKLRDLNEVLGKNTVPNKNSKNTSASKMAPMVLERKTLKPSVVISFLYDSSREGSDNSQDDEQCRAKQEFLKSGLPESFKKKMAKTAANREAYTLACASFQPVVHVQQKPMDDSMWTPPWPESPLLSLLKEWYQLSTPPHVSLEGRLGHCTVPAQRTCREKVSGWQEDFTEPVRQRLLDEIRASNPSFPVQTFFTRFLKARRDYMQTASEEPECLPKTASCVTMIQSVGGKRKRVDEGDRIGKLPKKQKSAQKEEEPIVITNSGKTQQNSDFSTSRGGYRRRSLRHKQTEKEPKLALSSTPAEIQCDSPIILDSPPTEQLTTDGMREDVLWTEKYQPHHSNDVIGNTSSVRKLHSWLREWKLMADREERRKQQERKQEDHSNDSWFGGDSSESHEEAEDLLCNTLLITGPLGIGKTAAVYACAHELGFKVFEVNCSSQRSGRQILSQLKEATQSHQVDIQGVNTHKPTYFNSYSSSSSTRPGPSPRKVNSPGRVVSSPKKPPQSPRGGTMRKGGLAPVSLANYFKMNGKPTAKDKESHSKKPQTIYTQKSAKVKQAEIQESANQEPKLTAEELAKRTATCLILFEEVDVIFDDDSGFLAAVKTFMATTKRPVILTSSDPTFSTVFDGNFDEIHFKAPSVVDVASYLQLLCLGENVRTDAQDLAHLLHWNKCDIRQTLLHLQFWTRSGGGRQVPRSILSSGASEYEGKEVAGKLEDHHESPPAYTPPCHVECTESLLGLLNIQQEKVVEDLLRNKPSAVESMRCWELLSEAERRGVNLLYSNLEVLLPLPIRPLPKPALSLQLSSNPQPEPGHLARHDSVAQQDEHSDDMSPVKVSSRMRQKKKLNVVNKHRLQSDSESDDDFLSLPKPDAEPAEDQDAKPSQNQESLNLADSKATSVRRRRRRRDELSEADKKKSKPVSQCLSALAEYMDNMSFLDSSLHFKPPQTEGACRPQVFDWAGAEVKSGMTDQVRMEFESSMSGFDSEEIRALSGNLSFWKCEAEISGAWNEVQQLEEPVRAEAMEELTLPVASHRHGFSLIQSTLCEPRVMDMRREAMDTVLTSLSLNTQGNRLAVATDYLPCLRNICKSEKLREQGKVKRRFMHYCSGIHLGLPKSTLQCLALDFP